MITLLINGKKETIEQTNVEELLKSRSIDKNEVVVELNKEIRKRDSLKAIFLNNDDVLEIIRFVGGG
jgi:sulfur carrier protein